MANGLSAEEAEALRQMQEEASSQLPDRRSEGDPAWLANGAQVELHSLQKAQTLNGQRGEIVGFDDKQLRYRVRLHSDNTVKVVAKKNMRVLTYADLNLPAGSSLPDAAPSAPSSITREVARKAIDRLSNDTLALQQRIMARKAGANSEALPDMSDSFLKLTASEETCKEVLEMYQRGHGRDEELDLHANAALEACEVTVQEYCEVRSWGEYLQDEVNVTKYNVQKHGLLGTLKNEVVEVGQDVRDLGHSAKEGIQKVAPQVPHLVRAATDTMGNVVQNGTAAAASTAGGFAARSQEHITNVVQDSVVTPVKRAWHFLVFGFLLCFLVPLFALRSYAPLNTVVSNLGVLYLAVCICCPPRGMHRRAAKAALILLYPLITVAMPLGVHYWATHPQFANDMSSALRALPSSVSGTVTRTMESIHPGHCETETIPNLKDTPAPPPAPAPPAPAPPAPAPAAIEATDDAKQKPWFLGWLQRFSHKPKAEAFIPAPMGPISYGARWTLATSNSRPRRFRQSRFKAHRTD